MSHDTGKPESKDVNVDRRTDAQPDQTTNLQGSAKSRHGDPVWLGQRRAKATVALTGQRDADQKGLTIYDLIEFGSGELKQVYVTRALPSIRREAHVVAYLKKKFNMDDFDDTKSHPLSVGEKWFNKPEIRRDIFIRSKEEIALILLDFCGYQTWAWESNRDGETPNAHNSYRMSEFVFPTTIQEALNVPYVRGKSAVNPWTRMFNPSAVDQKPRLGGVWFNGTLEDLLINTGITLDALTLGRFEFVEDVVNAIPDIDNMNDPQKRRLARFGLLFDITVKDILTFNYYFLSEEAAQEEFEPGHARQEILDEIDTARRDGDDKKLKNLIDKYKALLRRQRAACQETNGAPAPWTRNEMDIQDIIFSEKCILAANMNSIANMNFARLGRTKKYKKIEMVNGSPSEFINKLYMQKGWAEFIQYMTNLQISHLVPIFRFYKILYDDKGCPEQEIEITFPDKTDFKSMLKDSAGRGQVGVKNISWDFIGDNPSTIRNDITAKVTLFFQNFNELVKPHTSWVDAGDRSEPVTWRYVDILRRPPQDIQALIEKQRAAQLRGSKKNCADKSPDTSVESSETSKSTTNPEEDELDKPPGKEIRATQNPLDPRFYEIKMVVGWAPPATNIPGEHGALIKQGIKNNITPLFLTMIDHEFDIGQDGVFELTLSFRARIEGLLGDNRTNILATPYARLARQELNKELETAKADCNPEVIKDIKSKIKYHKKFQKGWLVDALMGDIYQGVNDHLGRPQLFTAVIDNGALVEAQYHTEKIKITPENCNVVFENPDRPGYDVFNESAGKSAREFTWLNMGQSLKGINTRKYKVAEVAKTATQDVQTDDSDVRNANWRRRLKKNSEMENAADREAADEKNVEQLKGRATTVGGGAAAAAHDFIRGADYILNKVTFGNVGGGYRGGIDTAHAQADLLRIQGEVRGYADIDADDFMGRKAKGDEYPIDFMFAGDLIEVATNHALDYMGTDLDASPMAFSPCAMENVKILLGPVSVMGLDGDIFTINVADIPISIDAFKYWFKKRITDQDRDSYALLRFIRDLIQDAVVDVLNADCFQGSIKQKISLKTGLISIPIYSDAGKGTSPIEERIKQSGRIGDGAPNTIIADANAAWLLEDTALANILPLSLVNRDNPLYEVDIWKKATEMFHYIYVYAETSHPATDLNGDYYEDFGKGIYHLYMGAERGLVKSIKFSKTDQPFLREARFEADALNPLAELSAVYKADVKLVGNTMFHPGQYVFISMQPLGKEWGHPSTENTPSNQLGLGGYHLITKVSNEITSDNQFETNLSCLWDTSGDQRSRLSSGAQTTVDKCPEEHDKTSISDGSTPEGAQAPPAATIEKP